MQRETKITETGDVSAAKVLLAEYQRCGKHTVKFPVYINETTSNTDIEALDLSPRSYNSLKRAGIESVGELMESIDTTQDLLRHRNLGQKSAVEIMYRIYLYQYRILNQERRIRFLNQVIELNRQS